jgi:hypothetical protein
MATFKYQNYQPLSRERAEFRLLTLKSRDFVDELLVFNNYDIFAGSGKVPIHCQLGNVPRHPIPSYTAISYVWTPKELDANNTYQEVEVEDVPIIVDNQYVSIRPNLESLLRNLQDPHEDIILWVDALSVNQDDNVEKSIQVPQMTSIYAEAVNTIVWLGPGDESSNTILRDLDVLGQSLCEIHVLEAFANLVKLSNEENIEPYQEASARVDALVENSLHSQEENALDMMSGFQKLCRLPYWQRTWILQEFVVSKNIDIRCGTRKIGFSHLRACMMFMPLLQLHMHAKLVEVVNNGGDSLHGEQIFGRWIKEFVQPLTSKTQGLFGQRVRYHGQTGNSNLNRQPLIQLLVRAHVLDGGSDRSECGNPRDKV